MLSGQSTSHKSPTIIGCLFVFLGKITADGAEGGLGHLFRKTHLKAGLGGGLEASFVCGAVQLAA